jgi:hypothetical protein
LINTFLLFGCAGVGKDKLGTNCVLISGIRGTVERNGITGSARLLSSSFALLFPLLTL